MNKMVMTASIYSVKSQPWNFYEKQTLQEEVKQAVLWRPDFEALKYL